MKENDVDEYDEDDYRKLDTGIYALDRTFMYDKRVEGLVNAFYESISFIKEHTDLSEDEIKEKINSKILDIELVDEYEDDTNQNGYLDNFFRTLSINKQILQQDAKTIYEFLRHEITHMISGEYSKKFWQKNSILFSGYMREDVYNVELEKSKKENESFNDAVVEMFGHQDDEYKEEPGYGHTVYTNQDFNDGLYCINSNIISQMMLARGIDKNTLFKGLYDRKVARKVEKKFNRKVFMQLSKNMDSITNIIKKYLYLESSREEGSENQELNDRIEAEREKLLNKIRESERIVIIKILMPRLKWLSWEHVEQILAEYQKFLICEGDYFKQVTGYQILAKYKQSDKKIEMPWLPKIDVDIQEAVNRQFESRGDNKNIAQSKDEK